MNYEHIVFERPADHVASVTMRRPERLNAINGNMLKELNHVVSIITRDDDIRAWLLLGAPRADGRPCFSAGVDIKAVREGASMSAHLGPQVTNRIDNMLKPSIAVIDGIASTGAVELALACDLRLVGDSAEISDWHLKHLGAGLGAWGSPTRWLQLVNPARVKEIILTGKTVSAKEAVEIGFANQHHPSNTLRDTALELAVTTAGMDPQGVSTALAHIQQSDAGFRDHSLQLAERFTAWLGGSSSFKQRADGVLGQSGDTGST